MRVFKVLSIVLLFAVVPVAAADSVESAAAAATSMGTAPAGGTVWAGPRALLYDNGPLVTSPGTGAGGADESVLQSTSLGMNILGFGIQLSSSNSLADDFTIPSGETWQIDNITGFGYQTGAGSPSTISGMYLRIYDGPPNAGGSVVWGDSVAGGWVTDVMSSTVWSNAYRVSETNLGNADRAIMANTATIGTALTEGTYWVEFLFDGSASFSGPWGPPITITGQTTTGDGLRTIGGVWEPLVDTDGTNTPQGVPFIVDGTVLGGGGGGGGGGGTGAAAEPIPTLSNSGIVILVLAFIGIAAVLIRRRM